MAMSYEEAKRKLAPIQNEDWFLLKWQTLTLEQKENFLDSIEKLVVERTLQQRAFLLKQKKTIPFEYFPLKDFEQQGSLQDQKIGKKQLTEGRAGAILVAGGQGTRLSYTAPKGTFPVTRFKKKSLFQLFSERTLAASHQVKHPLPLAIMTSPQNHQATVDYFQAHNLFGLPPHQLYFFSQDELPILSSDGDLLLQENGFIAQGPDGNGNTLHHFLKSGLWEEWEQRGIQSLNFILVDNPLADPFDAKLLGFHHRSGADVTIKAVERDSEKEKVGLIVQTEAGPRIIEYSEMSKKDNESKHFNGKLKYRHANTSLFCFDMNFVKKTSTETLPWHLAYKPVGSQGPKGWKFETFIFDLLPAAEGIKTLIYPKNKCFAPLKNERGENSLETVQEALLNYDRTTLNEITGHLISTDIELDPQFYYPTPDLLRTWSNKSGPFQGYLSI